MTALQKNADETEVKISQIMLPAMANSHGNVHGGEMLKLVDSIAYVCAARYCRGLCVTAAVDRVDFHQPIYVGELLSLTARIIYAGKTSMDVEIGVFAEDIPTGNVRHTNSCHLTLVHVVDGKP
ncbi:MAG: acyl-CoA thioesterase, partial [Armatimonadota bacterium]